MNLIQFDNVIKDPEKYLDEILKYESQDLETQEKTFGEIQQRDDNDEFCEFVLSMFEGYEVNLNFIIDEALNPMPLNDDSADITCFLYLDKKFSDHDMSSGTLFFDEDENHILKTFNNFNRMIAFDSDSVNFINRVNLVQVLFLKKIDDN